MRPLLIAACLLLAGCAGAEGTGCPPVPEYPPAFQTQAANELAALPPAAALRRMMDDYKRMRDQARACGK